MDFNRLVMYLRMSSLVRRLFFFENSCPKVACFQVLLVYEFPSVPVVCSVVSASSLRTETDLTCSLLCPLHSLHIQWTVYQNSQSGFACFFIEKQNATFLCSQSKMWSAFLLWSQKPIYQSVDLPVSLQEFQVMVSSSLLVFQAVVHNFNGHLNDPGTFHRR